MEKPFLKIVITFTVKENHVGSEVSEILRYRQKNLTTRRKHFAFLYIAFIVCKNAYDPKWFNWACIWQYCLDLGHTINIKYTHTHSKRIYFHKDKLNMVKLTVVQIKRSFKLCYTVKVKQFSLGFGAFRMACFIFTSGVHSNSPGGGVLDH